MGNRQPGTLPDYLLERGERPVLRASAQLLRGYAAGVRRVDVRVNGSAWEVARIVDPQVNRYP